MPVRLGNRLPLESEARIEIIPLIDIMFFLLASFMLVSLSMVNARSVSVNLPTATTATGDTTRNLLSLSVNEAGVVDFEHKPIGSHELYECILARCTANPDVRVFISGDRNARHGDIINVLDVVRKAGVQNVAFEIGAERHEKESAAK